MSKAVGIDLGTTNSVAAVIENGRPIVIPNAEGGRLTPSVVAFQRDGARLAGQLAKRQAAANPEHTIFSIKRQMGDGWKMRVDGVAYTPEKISSLILGKIKADVESYLGERVEQAVITVPAYFNDHQRRATQAAARIAGLEVLRIINEPTAAALSYGLHRQRVHKILVWDLGGGTFDVSILALSEGFFRVVAVNGNTRLGGDDWDQRITQYLVDKLAHEHGIELREDKIAYQRLKQAAETAKIELSSQSVTDVRLPFISDTDTHPLNITLTREQVEALTEDLLEKMVAPTRQALADAELKSEDIDRVVLVGGATRIPAVQALAKELLGQEPYKEIDPDQVVAVGAAIQAGILTGEVKDVILVDVTPLSLGIETRGGIFAKIIGRNTTIPVSRGQIFTNAYDDQAEIDVHVLQGERELAEYNMSLGKFQLDIPPLERGKARIEVNFNIDVDGIIHVTARDLHTDHEKRVIIDSPSGLSEEEIEAMVKEARQHAQQDEHKRREIEVKIRADNAIHVAEGIIEEVTDESQRKELQQAILRTKDALSGEDSDMINLRTEELGELIENWERQCQQTSLTRG
ncbi:MAG: molecular chaperone DnaK [Candidatus Bipolaricaulia bacterium]